MSISLFIRERRSCEVVLCLATVEWFNVWRAILQSNAAPAAQGFHTIALHIACSPSDGLGGA
eukprot:scaffold218253_cov17-Tisochrysis_lutea.AAC.1